MYPLVMEIDVGHEIIFLRGCIKGWIIYTGNPNIFSNCCCCAICNSLFEKDVNSDNSLNNVCTTDVI